MRHLLLILVAFLPGCATQLTLLSPPVPAELRVRCEDPIADPLTTADQYDLARALTQAIKFGFDCRARHSALVDAIDVRDQIMTQVKAQIDKR